MAGCLGEVWVCEGVRVMYNGIVYIVESFDLAPTRRPNLLGVTVWVGYGCGCEGEGDV